MKKVLYLCIVILSISASAQVGIGVPTSQISASAQLEVSSSSKGFLAPRMTQAQKNNIISPTAGLLVFQTDSPVGFYYFDGSVWQSGLGPQGVQGAQGATGPAGSNASITMGSISSSSSASGAAIASGVLTLAPADVNNGGVVTTGAQTFAGFKSFSNSITAAGFKTPSGTSSQFLMADGTVSSASSSDTHYVGESYGGGIVFYVYDGGKHGLIVAKHEIGGNGPENFTSTAGVRWGPSPINVGSFSNGIGAGNKNTDIIIAKTSNSGQQYFTYAQSTANGYAALFVAQYNNPSAPAAEIRYGDWYLPSLIELTLLRQSFNVISGSGSGFVVSHTYWSSIETNDNYAYTSINGGTPWMLKSTLNYVIPIRQF